MAKAVAETSCRDRRPPFCRRQNGRHLALCTPPVGCEPFGDLRAYRPRSFTPHCPPGSRADRAAPCSISASTMAGPSHDPCCRSLMGGRKTSGRWAEGTLDDGQSLPCRVHAGAQKPASGARGSSRAALQAGKARRGSALSSSGAFVPRRFSDAKCAISTMAGLAAHPLRGNPERSPRACNRQSSAPRAAAASSDRQAIRRSPHRRGQAPSHRLPRGPSAALLPAGRGLNGFPTFAQRLQHGSHTDWRQGSAPAARPPKPAC